MQPAGSAFMYYQIKHTEIFPKVLPINYRLPASWKVKVMLEYFNMAFQSGCFLFLKRLSKSCN